MRVYLYADDLQARPRLGTSPQAVRQVLAHVFQASAATALVVACYFPNNAVWGGKVCGGVATPATFQQHGGDHWAIVERWRPPADLPPRFRLVRLWAGADLRYPYTDADQYGWAWTFPSVLAHVATIAAHEAYHLMHWQLPADLLADEHQANDRALRQVWHMGFAVRATLPDDVAPAPIISRPGPGWSPWRQGGTTRRRERYAAARRRGR